jgi:hypothetical protein
MKNRNWPETIEAWKRLYDKYKALKAKGEKFADICDQIGVSERHMYRIKAKFE